MTPRDFARAEAFGRLAAKGGCGLGACPYEADGTPEQRTLAAHWVSAYLTHGGSVTVDYGDGPERSSSTTEGFTVTIARRRPNDHENRP